MSVLTLDVGGTNLSVACQRGGHAPPRKVGGDRSYSFSGAETASTRGEAMVVPVVLEPLSPATVATIRALFALGAQVPCAGDIFNNGGGTSDWSATITDELHETADRVTVSMTLYEVEPTNVSALVRTLIYLTDISSVDDPGDDSVDLANVATCCQGTFTGLRILNSATLITCGTFPDPSVTCATVYSLAPERSWMTLPIRATEIVGLMTVTFNSTGGTADKFAHQGVMAKVYLVRSGVDVEQVDTDWAASNGGFSGGAISMTSLVAAAWTLLDGDKIRVEVWGRIALHGGYADGNDGSNSDRQTILYGYLGAGVDLAMLSVGGLVTLL